MTRPAEPSPTPDQLVSAAAVALFERVPTGVVIGGSSGRVLHANPAALALLGYARDELIQLAITDLLVTSPAVATVRQTSANSGTAVRRTAEARHKDGRLVRVETETVEIDHQSGILLLCMLHERHLAQADEPPARPPAQGAPLSNERSTADLSQVLAELTAAETAAEAATITLAALTWLLEASAGVIVQVVSPAELEVLASTGFEGNLLRAAMRFPSSADLPIAEAARSGRVIRMENPGERLARFPLLGGLRPAGATATLAVPLTVDERTVGALSLFLSATRPYTADDEAIVFALARACGEAIARAGTRASEQAAREENEAALRQREALVAVVSHDLRSPLTAIKGETQLLQRQAARLGTPEGDRLAEGLEQIDSMISRMGLLLSDLSNLARSHAGEPPALNRRPTDLIEIARASVAEARLTAGARRIELQCDADQLTGNWDGARLERVIGNLLSNAIKYSPDGSTITVAVGREAGDAAETALLTVRDSGVGIPENEIARIFDPYHRGANVAGRTPGTGIGLVSARQIVEQHGGSITAASSLGTGSTFTVRLPLQ